MGPCRPARGRPAGRVDAGPSRQVCALGVKGVVKPWKNSRRITSSVSSRMRNAASPEVSIGSRPAQRLASQVYWRMAFFSSSPMPM